MPACPGTCSIYKVKTRSQNSAISIVTKLWACRPGA
jgi:hypothetical protein